MHPENSDLADKSNWTLAYSQVQNVPLVELIVNTPYGADRRLIRLDAGRGCGPFGVLSCSAE